MSNATQLSIEDRHEARTRIEFLSYCNEEGLLAAWFNQEITSETLIDRLKALVPMAAKVAERDIADEDAFDQEAI